MKRNKLSQKCLNDHVYVHYNLKLHIRKVDLAPSGPLNLDDIDPHCDWMSQEQPPLFTNNDIYDLER